MWGSNGRRLKLILVNDRSPGDVLMLTAAVRDLHAAYPRQFETGVDTRCPELWENNPYVAPLDAESPDAIRIDCSHPPLLNRCDTQPTHYVASVHDLLGRELGRDVPLTRIAPDVHVSPAERDAPPLGLRKPYWVVVAGGKRDLTTKWWPTAFYQRVVDYFRGRLHFVQAGQSHDHHPRLRGATDLVGHTSLREFVRLVYHADGVLCPVTAAMHLAAAFDKPCVVVAGGREPPHWEAYPKHQFLHTVGQLDCCVDGGCWKARVLPLGDGDERDASVCAKPAAVGPETIASCMALIEPLDACRAIDRYNETAKGRAAAVASGNAAEQMARAARSLPPYPAGFEGRGIVIPAGGVKYFPCAWVCVNMLRHVGCRLPVELWHLGPAEMTDAMRALVEPLGVMCVDAANVRRRHPVRTLNGWELKAYSLQYCRFRQVLLLDADNVPVSDPTPLFDAPEYRRTGAVFWPDGDRFGPGHAMWRLTGVPFRDEPEVESGQILLDKEPCWAPLSLAAWMNEHSDFWYRHVYGDKDTFRFAWHKLGAAYAMPQWPMRRSDGTMLQHDFNGRRLFQHRHLHKWSIAGPDRTVVGFWLEAECFDYLRALREKWQHLVSAPVGDGG